MKWLNWLKLKQQNNEAHAIKNMMTQDIANFQNQKRKIDERARRVNYRLEHTTSYRVAVATGRIKPQ